MNPALGFTVVLGALGVAMGGLRLAQRRWTVDPEVSRKAVHVGMGLCCAALPWLFTAAWPVWTLAAVAGAGLALVRVVPAARARLGGVLGGVARDSWGEIYFPVGVALVFTLARGDRVRFLVPVLVLTLADAAGALVGRFLGRTPVVTFASRKSVEGCTAVLGVAFACVFFPLWGWGGWGLPRALAAALAVALMTMLAEAVAWRGLDNLVLPLATLAQLVVYERLALDELAVRPVVLAALALLALRWKPRTRLDDGGLMAAAIGTYLGWAVGGWEWLVAPLGLLLVHGKTVPCRPALRRHPQSLPAILAVGAGALVWVVARAVTHDPGWLFPYAVGLTANLAMVTLAQLAAALPDWSVRRVCTTAAGAAGLVVFAPYLFVSGPVGELRLQTLGALAGVAATVAIHAFVEPDLRHAPVRPAGLVRQGLLGLCASCTALAVVELGRELWTA
jgi:phytol kinase